MSRILWPYLKCENLHIFLCDSNLKILVGKKQIKDITTGTKKLPFFFTIFCEYDFQTKQLLD